jgi:PAS domain S-box-containing protein
MVEAAPQHQVLVIEDLESDFLQLQRHLQSHGWPARCHRVDSLAELDAALAEGPWDLVLTDYAIPGLDFEAALTRLGAQLKDVPVILVTGAVGEDVAAELLRRGVADFVLKDRLGRLVPAIERALADVRQRRAAAAAAVALADSEAWSRALLQTLADGLFVAQDERFVFANQALAQMLGWPLEQFIGLSFQRVIAPEFLGTFTRNFWARVGGEQEPPRHYELPLRTQAGVHLWTELSATRFVYHGQPAVLGMVRNITERRRSEAELQRHRHHLEALVEERTRKAEEASRAKSAFLANMSHEIRTPMQTVLGLTGLLRRAALAPEYLQRLGQIDTAARHLLEILDGILDLSRIEAGRLQLADADFELSDQLQQVRQLVAAQAATKGLLLRLQPLPHPLWLRGDATRLRQALLNYAANAVKFSDQGQVVLAAQLLPQPPGAAADSVRLRLSVTDSGPGIAQEDLTRLFQAFEQVDTSPTRRHGGTGLGLAITRALAQAMGGEAGASSRMGEGSSFWFTVTLRRGQAPLAAGEPVGAGGAAAPSAEDLLRQRHGGARVLVAEDHPVNLQVAQALLEAAGLQVDAATDGEQAVQRVSQGRYDLVLMDMQMPRMDGLAAARAIRALPGCGSLPILAMTANAFPEDRAACTAAGMSDFISKPVQASVLFAQLLRWLPQRG